MDTRRTFLTSLRFKWAAYAGLAGKLVPRTDARHQAAGQNPTPSELPIMNCLPSPTRTRKSWRTTIRI